MSAERAEIVFFRRTSFPHGTYKPEGMLQMPHHPDVFVRWDGDVSAQVAATRELVDQAEALIANTPFENQFPWPMVRESEEDPRFITFRRTDV